MKKILTIFSILFVFVGANVNATDIVPYGSGYTTSEVYYKTNQYPIKIMGYETGATFQGKILAEVTVVHNDERTWSIGNIIHYRTDVNGVKVDSPRDAWERSGNTFRRTYDISGDSTLNGSISMSAGEAKSFVTTGGIDVDLIYAGGKYYENVEDITNNSTTVTIGFTINKNFNTSARVSMSIIGPNPSDVVSSIRW
ncbi:hypothetical protein [Rubeoparvulum massiliense]|uniref:hypothetical protein n=1 Tax=Rubeoparvulum massiliense TaxID=1631346 RepID=UPI00065DE71E|nr:hypothetical protein [Rubeoparvulum massiliense]